jgi:nucleoside-diphosphate-sugar epimerase
MAKILIVGCGSIGIGLANLLCAKGHQVTGVRRSAFVNINASLDLYQADITRLSDLAQLDSGFEYIVFLVAPDSRNEQSYRSVYQLGLQNVLQHFNKQTVIPQWIFASSTGVYAQTQGEWIDETSKAQPGAGTSQIIRGAERQLLALNSANIVVRFTGIYGLGREYLLNKIRQGGCFQQAPSYFTNRIHEQDCIGVLALLLEKHISGIELEDYYLASDDNPAPQWEVVSWLARQMHLQQPDAGNYPRNASMNKRCRNSKIKSLGYEFKYPSYQQGYGEILSSQKK